MDPKTRKLLDEVRDRLRLKQYAVRTEETCILWIRKYILFHNKCHPVEMGRIEVEAFLTHLTHYHVAQQPHPRPRITPTKSQNPLRTRPQPGLQKALKQATRTAHLIKRILISQVKLMI